MLPRPESRSELGSMARSWGPTGSVPALDAVKVREPSESAPPCGGGSFSPTAPLLLLLVTARKGDGCTPHAVHGPGATLSRVRSLHG